MLPKIRQKFGNLNRYEISLIIFLVSIATKTALFYQSFDSGRYPNALITYVKYIGAPAYNFIDSYRNIILFILHFIPALAIYAAIFLLIIRFGNRIIFFLSYLICTIFLLVNLVYYWHLNSFLTAKQYYLMLYEFTFIVSSGSFVFKYFYLVVLIDLPFLINILGHFPQTATLIKRRSGIFSSIFYLFTVYILFHLIISVVGMKSLRLDNQEILGKQLVMRHGLLLYDMIDAAYNHNRLPKIQYGKRVTIESGQPKQNSIIIIQVESLDAFVVNKEFNGEHVTPFLHDLTSKSLYYPYVMTTRKNGITSDCELTVLNGIEPFEQYPSMLSKQYMYPNAVTRRLKKADYSILAMHGNTASFYERGEAYAKMEFDRFYDINAMGLKQSGWGAPDHELFDFTLKKLREEREPFLYYLITMSSHEPFTSPLNYFSTDRFDGIGDELTRNYLKSMSYVDAELERFVREVRKERPGAYIFIFGDHTPFVLRREYYRRSAFQNDGKEYEFVPLFIITPDQKTKAESARVASFLDFSVTILEASGINSAINSDGVSLLKMPIATDTLLFRGEKQSRSALFRSIHSLLR